MEGIRKTRKLYEISVRRQFEGNRLEELVWAMAYEEVWPIVRRVLLHQATRSALEEERTVQTARSAAGA